MVGDEAAGSESAEYLRRVLDASRSGTLVVGLDGAIRYASGAVDEIVGASITGDLVTDWLHPDDVERAATSLAISEGVRGIRYFPMVFRVLHAEGHSIEVDVLAANLLDDPVIGGLVLSIRAADDRSQFIDPIRALARGADHDEVLELIIAGVGRGGHVMRPAFIATDRGDAPGTFHRLHAARAAPDLVELMERFVRDGAEPWAGLAPRSLASAGCDDLPHPLSSVLSAEGCAGLRGGTIGMSGEVVGLLLSAEPDELWLDGTWTPSTEDHWVQLLDLAAVAYEHHRVHARLVRAATHDALTGIGNRARFFDQLERVVHRAPVAVLYLDLDGFKGANDQFGHAAGDAVLVEVASRLSATVRPVDLVARLGGDEFAVAVADGDVELASDLADRLLTAVSAPFEVDGEVIELGVSIGLATHQRGQSADDLVRAADGALLAAKRSGRGGVVRAHD